MRYPLDPDGVAWNGERRHLQVPLCRFSEQGAWEQDRWFAPVGASDWTAVERFETVADWHDLYGIGLCFDNLALTSPHP